ncbi:MAG TPA: ribonuclease HI family protein [Candidatus Dormibacteraeota bacterium]|nr:ribonuclease HI family protein [Candidatus Dormibacteraeota bacterium]
MPTTTPSRRSGDESAGSGRTPRSLPSRPATKTDDQLRVLIYTDGAARGNPGPAGAGAILRDAATGKALAEVAEFLGVRTNNYAEWTAVELALEEALRLGATHVELRLDSELVARQISGRYRVKHPDLKPIHARVMALLARLAGYSVGHVPRELNKEADRLSNVAIDGPT